MGQSAGGGPPRGGDKSLQLGLMETLRLSWADEDIRGRMIFILKIFALYAIGIHIPVPIAGVDSTVLSRILEENAFFGLLNAIGGGAFKKVSIFALGLGPYITASIIMQILTQTTPAWKQEMKEGGEYARRQQNKRTRALTLVLAVVQGFALIQTITGLSQGAISLTPFATAGIMVFWLAGAMFLLWMGEQISERGIGNGVSLMIFAGIAISVPGIISQSAAGLSAGSLQWWELILIIAFLLATTWVIVWFTAAQRRIPIQHMRRNFGTQTLGGQSNYLPISMNMAGVIPIIFAVSLVYLPAQFAGFFPPGTQWRAAAEQVARYFAPNFQNLTDPGVLIPGIVGALVYFGMIMAFTYVWIAMMYNVEDISDNLKRGGSYIPGIRPGKQTVEFLNGVISRVTFVGAVFLGVVALSQYFLPVISRGGSQAFGLIGGTSLLILVSVALETMKQIQANLIVKQYGN
ncbi:MAG: preprotein translocase subunit SecY [Fimbriimonadaceae bacterium]|nr:preprotein translocase subunit SecY [Fimbriimonadaceae bacterium]